MSKYIFVGDNGTIIERSNAGVYTARTSGVAADLRYITRSPDGVLYVGGVETLLRSTDGGQSWDDISSVITWTAAENIRQISIVDEANIYITTNLRVLHYDGSITVTLLKSSAGISSFGGFIGIWAFATNDVWITVKAYRDHASWHYNGSTWTPYTLWHDTGPIFGSGSDIRALGYYNASDAGALIFIENGGFVGSDWAYDPKVTNMLTPSPWTGIHGSAGDNIIAPVPKTLSRIDIIRWDGSAWSGPTLIRSPDASGVSPRSVFCITDSDAAVACTMGVVMIQTAAPETWTEEDSATTGTSEDLYGVVGLAGPVIGGIDRDVLSDAGGELITVSGAFEVGEVFAGYLGPNGDATDTPVRFAGLAKGATLDVVSSDTLQIVTPPVAKGTHQLTLIDSGGMSGNLEVQVSERSWPAATFRLRRGFDRTILTGPRTIDGEPKR